MLRAIPNLHLHGLVHLRLPDTARDTLWPPRMQQMVATVKSENLERNAGYL